VWFTPVIRWKKRKGAGAKHREDTQVFKNRIISHREKAKGGCNYGPKSSPKTGKVFSLKGSGLNNEKVAKREKGGEKMLIPHLKKEKKKRTRRTTEWYVRQLDHIRGEVG